jgi:hypothetical protein
MVSRKGNLMTIHRPRIRRKAEDEDAVLRRNQSVRLILRTAFAGRKITPSDGELAMHLSVEMLDAIKRNGADDDKLKRQVRFFAGMTLLSVTLGEIPPFDNATIEFLLDVFGLDGQETLNTLTDADREAIDAAGRAMNKLVTQPAWAQVHRGHTALACIALLSNYNPALLYFSTAVRPHRPSRALRLIERGNRRQRK